MKKFCTVLVVCLFLATGTARAQVLFTYGNSSVDAKEFLKAYTRNNPVPAGDKAKSIRNYLDLYINSRLKIREAYERRYDTLPQLKSEVTNLREQIIENYMNDPSITARLNREAFQRSLKDIHVAHIFISFTNAAGMRDTSGARQESDIIYQRLKQGEDFKKLAGEFSDDPSVTSNGGDIGYITVFTLPYEFENAIYSTPAGKVSAPVFSKSGIHIFKNLGERKAKGKIKVQQILLAIPPGSDEAAKRQIANKADSLYKRIIAGENFDKLAAAFSNDYVSALNGGRLPEISVGQYSPRFETLVWSLPKNGAVSKPFLTTHGYHIVKRLSIVPVVTDPNNKSNQVDLAQKVSLDSRWRSSREFIYEKVARNAGFKKENYSPPALWAFTDSLLENKPAGEGRSLSRSTVLFTIGDTAITIGQWAIYAQANRFKQDGTGLKPYDQVMDEFIKASFYNYYRDHLEDYNEDFRWQMNEFKEGNLFFEIMQREIWNRGHTDTTALMALYEKNRNKYFWKPSADALIFFSSDSTIAKTVYEQVKKTPGNWKMIIAGTNERVAADSSRYEWEQLPNLGKQKPRPGMITTPLVNASDNTATFAYIINVYSQPAPRSFNEAKGLVINDYQVNLEEEWIRRLRQKYPVTINEAVLASITK